MKHSSRKRLLWQVIPRELNSLGSLDQFWSRPHIPVGTEGRTAHFYAYLVCNGKAKGEISKRCDRRKSVKQQPRALAIKRYTTDEIQMSSGWDPGWAQQPHPLLSTNHISANLKRLHHLQWLPWPVPPST